MPAATAMMTGFLRNILLPSLWRPVFRPACTPASSAIRAFSSTPSQSTTLNQVMRVSTL